MWHAFNRTSPVRPLKNSWRIWIHTSLLAHGDICVRTWIQWIRNTLTFMWSKSSGFSACSVCSTLSDWVSSWSACLYHFCVLSCFSFSSSFRIHCLTAWVPPAPSIPVLSIASLPHPPSGYPTCNGFSTLSNWVSDHTLSRRNKQLIIEFYRKFAAMPLHTE